MRGELSKKFGMWLFPLFDCGTELAKRRCRSRRTTKRDGGSDEDATRSADQRKQMDGGNPQKVDGSHMGRTELK